MFVGVCWLQLFFFFKQKTAYEMRISDWSSDVCSSDLLARQLYESQGEAFDALAERNGIAPEQRRMVMGDPARVLASYAASHEIDVIVMGRVHYGRLDKLIGSTVEGLLYKMPCSLWVIAQIGRAHV